MTLTCGRLFLFGFSTDILRRWRKASAVKERFLHNAFSSITLENENTSSEKLIAYFKGAFPLNAVERNEIIKHVEERTIKRRQFILQSGDVCRHFTFVVSGCFKMYAVDQAGKAHNVQFVAENDWITDLSSFYEEAPSLVNIEAIEHSVILRIKHADLLRLYTNYHKFDRNFRIILERKFIVLQNRILQNISLTSEQRYDLFLKQFPRLAARLPNTQIASYLGITPEFLSKIRKGNGRRP